MRQLTLYEFAGVFLPGAVICLGAGFMYLPSDQLSTLMNMSVGGLGVGFVAAYVAGHLLQSLGNLFEKVWWAAQGGMPTDRALVSLSDQVGSSVAAQIDAGISRILNHHGFIRSACSRDNWKGIVRQMYAHVLHEGNVERIEIFNANYGLLRGLSTAFCLLIGLLVVHGQKLDVLLPFFVSCFALSVARMQRFGRYYSRELLLEFSRLKAPVRFTKRV